MDTAKNYILSGLMAAYLAVAPAHAEHKDTSHLIQESQTRQERLLERRVSEPQSYVPAKAPEHKPFKFSTGVNYNPGVNLTIEALTIGPIDYFHAVKPDTGKLAGNVVYLNFDKHFALYGFGSGGKWDLGPAFSTTVRGIDLSLVLTASETSLYISKDGYGGGPINLKGNWQDTVSNLVQYNAASFLIEKVAGRDARKKAQRIYAVANILRHPTPLTFALQLPGAIKAHKKDKGFKRVYKTLGHALTFGLFHKDKKQRGN